VLKKSTVSVALMFAPRFAPPLMGGLTTATNATASFQPGAEDFFRGIR
jgi:hypothetical protein